MPTTILTGTAPAYLPARPISLTVDREGFGDPVVISIVPEVDARRPRPGMVVVPTLDRQVTVSVRPASGAVFDDPTVLHLTAAVAVPGSEELDRVLVPSIRVSGLPALDMLVMTPADGQIGLARPAEPDRIALSPLGEEALTAARATIGATRRPESELVDMAIAVDASASMIVPARTGALSAAIDVLTGVAPAIARNPVVVPQIAFDAGLSARTDAAGAAGTAVAQMIGARPLPVGFAARRFDVGNSASITYVVTDGIPADLYELGASIHLVVLADQSAESVLRSMCALPVTLIDVNRSDLLADRQHLDRTVRSLLAGRTVSAPGVGGVR